MTSSLQLKSSVHSRSALVLALATATVLALVGCESSTKLNDGQLAGVETRTPSMVGGEGSGGRGGAAGAVGSQSGVASVDLAGGRGGAGGAGGVGSFGAADAQALAAARQRVVYFDYDSFSIRDDFKPLIEAHARVLVAQSDKRVVIEGHTDERGGREYNLALGQKRADAVTKALTLLGVPSARLEAVSFGQERPALQGAGESAWAQNRRAELRDR